jgi:hypothetical protein
MAFTSRRNVLLRPDALDALVSALVSLSTYSNGLPAAVGAELQAVLTLACHGQPRAGAV